MEDRWPTLKVAAIQAAPAFLNREESVRETVRLLAEAAGLGAELIVFPEGFIPAHPVWYHFHAATSRQSLQMARELAENAVVVPGAATAAVANAARSHRAHVVLGVCERDAVNPGLLYNSQLFFGPDGTLTGRHRKIMPTVGERLVHTPGFGDTMKAVPTPYGPIGGLICGEASNPLAIFSLASQGTRVLAVSWPNHFSKNEHPMRDVIELASRAIGYRANCYVISAAGVINDRMRRRLPSSDDDLAFLNTPGVGGGTLIVDPHGNVAAGPLGNDEAILTAEIDLGNIISAKLVHDYAGHYNRPEIFTLVMRTDRPQLFREWADPPSHGAGAGDQQRTAAAQPESEPSGRAPITDEIGPLQPSTSPVLLVPADMSESSEPAVAQAIDLAQKLGAGVELFYVIPEDDAAQRLGEGKFIDVQLQDAADGLAAWLVKIAPAPARQNVAVHTSAGVGRPADEILAKAEALHARVIVMGTLGRTGLPSAMLGSVAEAVVRRAPCPVLTVRAPASTAPKKATGEIPHPR